MDTREKIIRLTQVEQATAGGCWVIVASSFDPLTADVADWLARIKEDEPHSKVLALVLEQSDAFLSAEARAALVAALRTVNLVSIGRTADLAACASYGKIVYDPIADRHRAQALVDLVLMRQKAVAG